MKNRSKFWFYQSVNIKKNISNIVKHNELLKHGRTVKLFDSKIKDIQLNNEEIYKEIGNIVKFLNQNYEIGLFFTLNDFLFLIDTHFPENKIFNILKYNGNIIGTAFYKIYNIHFYGKNIKIVTGDFGCVLKKYRKKKIFPYLMETGILIVKKEKLEFAFHKKDIIPLSIQEHLKYNYNYFTKKSIKNIQLVSDINIVLKPKITEEIYRICMFDLKQKKIYFNFKLNEFIKEFENNEIVKTLMIKYYNKITLINGFIQDYQNKRTFEIRYILGNIDNNILKKIFNNILNSIFEIYNVSDIIYQNIGNNLLLDELDFNKGHDTYLYLYNYPYKEINKEDFYFFF